MKRKVYTIRSAPRRLIQVGSAVSCGFTSIVFGAIAISPIPIVGPPVRLWLLAPAAGCAGSSLYMFKQALTPETVEVK